MPSNTFQRADTRYLAAALADGTTHAGIGAFEMSLDLATEGNKGERANQVISHAFRRADTDAIVVSLLNFLYVENPYADSVLQRESFLNLKQNVLDRRGVTLTDNGYALPDGSDVDSLPLIEGPASSFNSASVDQGGSFRAGQTVANSYTPSRDQNKVFVVHGRDLRPVVVLRQFLQYLGLQMMTWSEAVALTRESQPHTYDVVKAGMSGAAAIIVIFSPDDLARVKDDFSDVGDTDRNPQGQPRQNVLLEAGMAFAFARDRTIFVKSAQTRDISDIAGFNWVKLDGRYDSRLDLKNRLATLGASVRNGEYDLTDVLAGDFRV